MDSYPHLHYLLAAYFHQNWRAPLERSGLAPTSELVVTQFKTAERPEVSTDTARDIDALLARGLSEDELRSVLSSLGSFYYAPGDDLTFQQWLTNVRNLLSP